MHGYVQAHAAMGQQRWMLEMDLHRIAVNADADAYAAARRQLQGPQRRGAEPAWQRAKRAFERAGSLRPGPAD